MAVSIFLVAGAIIRLTWPFGDRCARGIGKHVREWINVSVDWFARWAVIILLSVVDAVWLDEELSELERLVEAGETLETVSRLAVMSREPRYAVVREDDTVLEDTLH